MFVFGSRSSRYAHGNRRPVRVYWVAAIAPDPRFEVKGLGEIDMVSRALATLRALLG